MNQHKIFFFDLDGTLLNSQKVITPATRAALETFTAAGNHFVINTGRAMDSVRKVQEDLNLFFPGTFLAAFNGAQIYDCDGHRDIYRTGIPVETVGRIFDLAARHDVHVHTYTDTHIVATRQDEGIEYYRRVIPSPVLLADDVRTVLPQPPCKCIAIELHDHEKMERFHQELDEMVIPALKTMYSNPFYLEIFPAEAGKGSAVTRLCELLDIPVRNSLAAGDEQNDISMIKAAGTGIAMLNGTDAVKAIADVVTTADNDHDGLAKFLRV